VSELREMNFDGLVGPTHNYAGLSPDNVASVAHRDQIANPRAAAFEGIAKMRTLMELGVPQAFLPPHERPHVPTLRRLGFDGSDAAVLRSVAAESPHLLAVVSSASSMWAANAATVCASCDSDDGLVHLTPANLVSHGHRAIETATTRRILQAVFDDPRHFVVHDPLPATATFADEGAANHIRLGPQDGPGVHLMVFGRTGDGPGRSGASPRQTLAASKAIARLHGTTGRTIFAKQHPDAIRAGAFHNDVVAVGRAGVLLCHERAYVAQRTVLVQLRRALAERGVLFQPIVVPQAQVSLDDAVRSYLFNGQLVGGRDGRVTLIVPAECRDVSAIAAWLAQAESDPTNPIERVVYVDVRESMRNGGGPACLRLCVPLRGDEQPRAEVVATPERLDVLESWVARHYRDRLAPRDLADPSLLDESRAALDELTVLLGLGSVYGFQRDGS
jgi:succinylarginine dihydrolase